MATNGDLRIEVPGLGATTGAVYRASDPPLQATLVLAHGAGAGQRSPWIVDTASALAARGMDVMTFDFLYTHNHRRLPDRTPALEACYTAAVHAARMEIDTARRALFIGGKSMGGRIATQIAAADPDLPIAGLVLLGYPLHPPGRPEQRRDRHLPALRRPMLIVQGSRDAFGTPDELRPIVESLGPACTLHVIDGGDHSFKLSKRNPAAQAAVQEDVVSTVLGWVRRRA